MAGVIQLASTHFSVAFRITYLTWYRYPVVAGPSGRLVAEFAGAWGAATAAITFPFPPSRLNPGIVRAATSTSVPGGYSGDVTVFRAFRADWQACAAASAALAAAHFAARAVALAVAAVGVGCHPSGTYFALSSARAGSTSAVPCLNWLLSSMRRVRFRYARVRKVQPCEAAIALAGSFMNLACSRISIVGA